MLNKYKNFIYKKIYRKITDKPVSNILLKKFDFVNNILRISLKNLGKKIKINYSTLLKYMKKIKKVVDFFQIYYLYLII